MSRESLTEAQGSMQTPCVLAERPRTAKDALCDVQRLWILANGYDPDVPASRFRDVWYMHPVTIGECECYSGDHLRSFVFRFVQVNMRGQGGIMGEEHVRAATRREATLMLHDRVTADPEWDPRGRWWS